MRWLFGRGARVCPACGAELERGAAWCGVCGARADGSGDTEQEAATQAPAGPADEPVDQPRLARRTLVGVVALVLLALAVAWQLRSPIPEPLLGHLGQSTGLSATGPPPSGLRLAWAHESPAWGGGRSVPSLAEVVARGDRVRVGHLVVELQGGQLVRVSPDLRQATGVQRTVVDGRELLVVDTLSGEVRSRTVLAEDYRDHPLWAVHRGRGVTLFRFGRQSTVVADGGSVVAEVDGVFIDDLDRAFEDPLAFPVRRIGDGREELGAGVQLVAAETGDVVLDLPAGRARVVDVVGDLAMVADTEGAVATIRSPADISDRSWRVRLLDARTGQERERLEVDSREPPRLLGMFDAGPAVLATRVGDEYVLHGVATDGRISTLARFDRPQHSADGGMHAESSVLGMAALAGDVLVVRDGDGTIVGLDRTGSRLWDLDVAGAVEMGAGDGYVVLFVPDANRLQVVRASDGEVVTSLDPPAEDWAVAGSIGLPIAAIGGHVGISRSANSVGPHQGPLVGTTWFDLRTGEAATLEDVFARFAGDEERIGPDWIFHGIVTDDQGKPEPVVSRTQPQGRFELLDPGEGFRTHRLPLPPTDGEPDYGVASVGATADRFAVREGVRDPADLATIVLDRMTGTTTTIEGLRGVALLDDLLLAEKTDESNAALVAVDPATGEERWRAEPHARHPGGKVLLVDADLVIDTGVARVTARSTHDGTQRWSHASDTVLSGDAVLGPRHVVVATTNGQLVALDRRDGTVAWRADIETPIASLTGAGDHVLVGTHNGLIVHLDRRGREVQRIAAGTGAVHEVAALGQAVVAVVDGRVIGLREDGTGIIRDDEVEVP